MRIAYWTCIAAAWWLSGCKGDHRAAVVNLPPQKAAWLAEGVLPRNAVAMLDSALQSAGVGAGASKAIASYNGIFPPTDAISSTVKFRMPEWLDSLKISCPSCSAWTEIEITASRKPGREDQCVIRHSFFAPPSLTNWVLDSIDRNLYEMGPKDGPKRVVFIAYDWDLKRYVFKISNIRKDDTVIPAQITQSPAKIWLEISLHKTDGDIEIRSALLSDSEENAKQNIWKFTMH